MMILPKATPVTRRKQAPKTQQRSHIQMVCILRNRSMKRLQPRRLRRSLPA